MDVLLTILGALLGWGVSHLYYLKSLNDLKADAEERRRMEELVFRGIESVGNIKYSRDAAGKIVDIVIELKGSAVSSATATARYLPSYFAGQGTFPFSVDMLN